jgi:hypothetical protein
MFHLSSVVLNAATATSWVTLQTSATVFIPTLDLNFQLSPSPVLFLDLLLVHSVPIVIWLVTPRRTVTISMVFPGEIPMAAEKEAGVHLLANREQGPTKSVLHLQGNLHLTLFKDDNQLRMDFWIQGVMCTVPLTRIISWTSNPGPILARWSLLTVLQCGQKALVL